MIDYKREKLATIFKVGDIVKHPNGDRLDIASFGGWECIIGRDSMKTGDLCVYFEIDSILNEDLECKIFEPDSKIKLKNGRVKTIKIRGQFSQGLAVPIETIFSGDLKTWMKHGYDVTKILEVGKYVPTPKEKNILYVNRQKKKYDNIYFKKVRKPGHIQNESMRFDGKNIAITEKLHGTNAVTEWVKRNDITILDKIKNIFRSKYEFCFRSHNVQLHGRKNYTGYYGNNVYANMVRQYDLERVLPKGYGITYEIIGYGIQKGYQYGIPDGEHKIVIFGVRKDGKNIPFEDAYMFCKKLNLPYTPVLYKGKYSLEKVMELTNGNSIYDPETKVREGVVVERLDGVGGVSKSISKQYLLKDTTEFK